MNYRRGLLRVYAVLTVAWIGYVFLVTPSEYLKFWSVQPSPLADIAETLAPNQLRIVKAIHLAVILFLPPLLGYAGIYLVIPRIFRGRRPGTQI
jgi:hypothetical protein